MDEHGGLMGQAIISRCVHTLVDDVAPLEVPLCHGCGATREFML
jgi:hypothetical protein